MPCKSLTGVTLKTGSGWNIPSKVRDPTLMLQWVHHFRFSIHQQNPMVEVHLPTPMADLMPSMLLAHLLRQTYRLLMSLESNLHLCLPIMPWTLVFPNQVASLNVITHHLARTPLPSKTFFPRVHRTRVKGLLHSLLRLQLLLLIPEWV